MLCQLSYSHRENFIIAIDGQCGFGLLLMFPKCGEMRGPATER